MGRRRNGEHKNVIDITGQKKSKHQAQQCHIRKTCLISLDQDKKQVKQGFLPFHGEQTPPSSSSEGFHNLQSSDPTWGTPDHYSTHEVLQLNQIRSV